MRKNNTIKNVKIDVHADDYALSINTSKDMLECMKKGYLNSISIVPNMSCFDECISMLYEAVPTLPFLPLMSVHIDLIEGKWLTSGELLTFTWGKLFAYSYLLGEKHIMYKQLADEISAQIKKVDEVVKKCMEIAEKSGVPYQNQEVRIDSHQHTHMMPIVWKSLLRSINEGNYKVEYIRNSKEVLAPFLSVPKLYSTYRPVNFIKNRLLNFYSGKVDRYIKKSLTGKIADGRVHINEHMLLWGLVMSGKMDEDRIGILYDKMTLVAEKKHRTLEILFHPGLMLSSELTEEIPEKSAHDFYFSSGRHTEMDALKVLHG